ncbi:radical SAM protein [Rurimicrobium arvi]|uniref:Radical SAM protein n=1 Tax=Rurimicrobium arvi TaxID=2049916 RepID=A0ABP8MXD6_9BACT
MKRKVLFTHSYFLQFDPKQWEIMQPYAPLGTIYAAALLRENGYETALHDVMFLDRADTIEPVLQSFKPDVVVVYDDGFNYLTKMCLTNMREAAFDMARLAKQYGCTTVASSSDSTDHYLKYLDNGFDYVIAGEAEHTLLEWINHFFAAAPVDLKLIPGLIFRNGPDIVKTPKRPVITDLDTLPFPAWDLVDVDQYKNAWRKKHGYFSINFATTRGCPYKCNWCAKPIYGNRYNARTPEHVCNELKMLHDRYGFDHIWFCDDIFGLKPGWVKEFARLLKQASLRIRFKIQSRADLLLSDEQVQPLAEAGCETVWMGAESGSQKILDAMDKGTTIAQIAEATAQLRHHHIRTAFFLQFGYLGETKEDIRMTFDMLKQLTPDEIGVSVSYPLPGTRFYEKVKAELSKKTNWTDSDEMAVMFKGTYEPEFYKKLHRYAHTFYRKLQNDKKAKQLQLRALLKMPLYAFREFREKRILK